MHPLQLYGLALAFAGGALFMFGKKEVDKSGKVVEGKTVAPSKTRAKTTKETPDNEQGPSKTGGGGSGERLNRRDDLPAPDEQTDGNGVTAPADLDKPED